jgi:hypothetical protein
MRVTKSGRRMWIEDVARIIRIRSAYWVLLEKRERRAHIDEG